MAERITVYEKPTCTKCREVDKILRESGVAYDKINYYLQPISEIKLRELLSKLKISPRELLRSTEKIYKELELARTERSDDELIKLMIEYPDLIQRPIVEKGDRAVLGRPVENIKKLL